MHSAMGHTYLVTGAAGFIGYHVSMRLLELGHRVTAFDNLNAYYAVGLKLARLRRLERFQNFKFEKLCLSHRAGVHDIFDRERPDFVIHLAAQAGVRYSIDNPAAYVDSNLVGFANILEGCRYTKTQHLVFASSSSVYGNNHVVPFSEDLRTDQPVSLYAATKKANEVMAYSYAHLFSLPCTGLRFFTVYGPWGRPDMALFKFTSQILRNEPIDVFNFGNMERDFTYIDDITLGILKSTESIPKTTARDEGQNTSASDRGAPYRIYNIGNNTPVSLLRLIEILEDRLGRQATRRLLPMQPGDVPRTWADISDLDRKVGYAPSTPIELGITHFVNWYRDYYNV